MVRLWQEFLGNGQILACKESTVNFHVSNILRKFDVPTRVAAVIKAIRYGMLAEQ